MQNFRTLGKSPSLRKVKFTPKYIIVRVETLSQPLLGEFGLGSFFLFLFLFQGVQGYTIQYLKGNIFLNSNGYEKLKTVLALFPNWSSHTGAWPSSYILSVQPLIDDPQSDLLCFIRISNHSSYTQLWFDSWSVSYLHTTYSSIRAVNHIHQKFSPLVYPSKCRIYSVKKGNQD